MNTTASLVVAAALLAAACTSEDPPGRDGPARGGTVRFGILGEPATLDPHARYAADLTWALAGLTYPSLFDIAPDGSPIPDLVRSIATTERGVEIELHDRKWSDGTSIDARDVAATVRRARPPSGFAEVTAVRVTGPRTIELRGRVENWRQTLALVTFVLPEGRARPGVSGGPFVLERRVRGRELIYQANTKNDPRPLLDEIRVLVVERSDTMLALLDQGKLDGAALPLSVNLEERVRARELEYAERLGWERVYLDFEGSLLDEQSRLTLAAAIDRKVLERGFIRSSGRLANTVHPEPGPNGASGEWADLPVGEVPPDPDPISISAPVGDELLEMVQRAMQVTLLKAGFTGELITVPASTFYGRWSEANPTDVSLRRRAGAPGLADPARYYADVRVIPLFHVATPLVWRAGLQGMAPNPTLAGPFWNAAAWWRGD